MSVAGTDACNCLLLWNVVGKVVPFQRAWAPGVNPEPASVSVNPDPPGVWLTGVTGALRKGTGLTVGETAGFTVSRLLCDTPPELTVTVAVVIAATDEVVTWNWALVAPAGTLMLGDTCTTGLSLDN